MLSEPTIVDFEPQPYVAIKQTVTMATIGLELAPLAGEVFGWLGAHGVPPAGPPFWRYDVIDMTGKLVVEVGVPVGEPVEGDGRVSAGTIPSGRYAMATFIGHPDGLQGATATLLAWATTNGLTWDVTKMPSGEEVWGSRVEFYDSDPAVEPDMTKWHTRLAFRLLDDAASERKV